MDYKIAKAAANWWIEQLKRQCNHLYPTKVIYDGSNFKVIDDSLNKELSSFEEVLFNEILNCITKRSYLSLTYCWHPNRSLSRLINQASISIEYLPPRAAMQICGNSVEVSLDGEDSRKLTFPAK